MRACSIPGRPFTWMRQRCGLWGSVGGGRRLHAAGHAASQIFFITGADAFAEIATWSRYPAVLDLANFVVVSRTGITLNSLRERVPSAFRDQPPCAPSDLRVRASDKSCVILLEARTPDISSTDIRRRVRAGHSLAGLVPEPVARYIATHRLYAGPPMAQN